MCRLRSSYRLIPDLSIIPAVSFNFHFSKTAWVLDLGLTYTHVMCLIILDIKSIFNLDLFVGQRVVADTYAKEIGIIIGFKYGYGGWPLVIVKFDNHIGGTTIYKTSRGEYHPHAILQIL